MRDRAPPRRGRGLARDEIAMQSDPLCATSAFVVAAPPGVIDENAPHQAGGYAEKVRTVLPLDVPGVRQP